MNSEIDPGNKERIAAGFLLIRIVLAFFVLTVVILTLLPHIGIIKLNIQGLSPQFSFTNIFLVLGVFLAGSGFMARRILLKANKIDESKEPLSASLQTFHTAHIVAFAMFEAVAILGFINFMMSADAKSNLVFSAISLGCMFFAWPKLQEFHSLWRASLREADQVKP